MRKPESKCLDCKDRKAGCHSACEKYKEYRHQVDLYHKYLKEVRSNDWIADYRPWMRRGKE